MVRKQRQMRYVKDGDPRNYPAGLTKEQLISGTCWDTNTRIVELSIQAVIGFGFYVNDTPTPLRILNYQYDPNSTNAKMQIASRKFTFPKSVLQMAPIYNIKMEAESMQRLINYNSTYGEADEIWLFIDYINEEI